MRRFRGWGRRGRRRGRRRSRRGRRRRRRRKKKKEEEGKSQGAPLRGHSRHPAVAAEKSAFCGHSRSSVATARFLSPWPQQEVLLWPQKETLLWTTRFHFVATAGVPLRPQRKFSPCGHSRGSRAVAVKRKSSTGHEGNPTPSARQKKEKLFQKCGRREFSKHIHEERAKTKKKQNALRREAKLQKDDVPFKKCRGGIKKTKKNAKKIGACGGLRFL